MAGWINIEETAVIAAYKKVADVALQRSLIIAAVVVGGTPLTGGIGRIRGTVLGVLIIAILSNGMNMTGVDPYLQNILKGLVLIIAVFLTIDRSKILIIK